MKIKIMYLGNTYYESGKQMEYFESEDKLTVRKLLFSLVGQYGDEFKAAIMNTTSTIDNISLRVLLAINGQNINGLNGMDTELKDGDTLIFMVPVEGGSTVC